MRPSPNERIEQYRITDTATYGTFASDRGYGNNGMFVVPAPTGEPLQVIASDGMGWEHVSVSCARRCPRWEEMDYIKRLFWGDEETVMQLHPPRSMWVNNHPYCLHLWKPTDAEIPLPATILVGLVGFEGKVRK